MAMAWRDNSDSKGSAGCGCFLLIIAIAAWGFSLAIFPKLPDYDKAMEEGTLVPGKVLRVEKIENIKINGKRPRKVIFSYGDGQEGSMMMGMKASAKKGQEIQVRVLGARADQLDEL